jgi:hypothetical protein
MAYIPQDRKPKIVTSPQQNAAEKELLIIQDATTKIKEIIASDIANGVSNKETSSKINVIISSTLRLISDVELRQEVKQSLIQSAKSWYYEHSQHMRALASNMAKELDNAGYPELKQQVTPNTVVQWDKTVTFRGYRSNAETGVAIIEDYQKKVKNELIALASDPPISTRLTKDGEPYKISLRNRAEMKVRYEANKQDVERMKSENVKLVWISSHANASARCSPYQGKLYSLDGTSGTTKDGIKYTPLDDALRGPKGDGNGIVNGYNCRHYLIEYFVGSRAPIEFSEKEIERERKIDTRQRQYENSIRNMKVQERLFRAYGDKEEASILRKRWQNLNTNYKKYSLTNGRPYYEDRTRISDDEINAMN